MWCNPAPPKPQGGNHHNFGGEISKGGGVLRWKYDSEGPCAPIACHWPCLVPNVPSDLTVHTQSDFAGLKHHQIKSIQKQQRRIMDILNAKQIPYEVQDISTTKEGGAQMRLPAGSTALALQIAKGHQYRGDHAGFEKAPAEQTLDVFLGEPVPRKHAERKKRTIRRRMLAAMLPGKDPEVMWVDPVCVSWLDFFGYVFGIEGKVTPFHY